MAGLWRFSTANGPGVPKDLPRPVGFRLLADVIGREWGELVKLNLLFLVAALPLVTLPAALVGMLRVCRFIAEDRPRNLVAEFVDGVRGRFVAATLAGFALVACEAVALAALAVYARAGAENILFAGPVAVCIVVAVALPLFGISLFVAMATSDRPILALLRPAALALALQPGRLLSAAVAVGLLWLVHILFYPVSVLMPVLINFSFGALAMTFGAHDAAVLALSEETTTAGDRERDGGREARLLWRSMP